MELDLLSSSNKKLVGPCSSSCLGNLFAPFSKLQTLSFFSFFGENYNSSSAIQCIFIVLYRIVQRDPIVRMHFVVCLLGMHSWENVISSGSEIQDEPRVGDAYIYEFHQKHKIWPHLNFRAPAFTLQ